MPTYKAHRPSRCEDEWLEDISQFTTITVHEERDPVDTGLLDSNGHSIYRHPNTVKMGYCGKAKG